MDRDRWKRLIELSATALLSNFARIFGGLVSVYVGYKLFAFGASKQPPSGLSGNYAIFTSGVLPGLILIAFGVVVIPGKLEHMFNENVLVILAGIISIVLGYSLFKTGIVEAGSTEFKLQNKTYTFLVSGQAPGLFFMLFGVSILIFYLWTMRPQKDIVVAQAQRQSEMINQICLAIERLAPVRGSASGSEAHESRPHKPSQ